MGAESQRKAGKADGTGATPDSAKADRQQLIDSLQLEKGQPELIDRLELDNEQISALGNLDKLQLNLWFQALEASFAPEDWLTGIDVAIQEAKPVPAFHVPTAEGIATYPGLLGSNGSAVNGDRREREIKDFIIGLLQNAISRPPEDPSSNGHTNGNGAGNGDGAAEKKAEGEQQS